MIRDLVRRLKRKNGALRQAGEYASFILLKPKCQVRVLIFAQGRTGSTLLESLLTESQHFVGKGEVLGAGASRVRFPRSFLSGMAKRHAPQNFVAHVKIYHLTQDREKAGARPTEPGAFLRKLAATGWHIIYLRREDRVRQVISNEVAKARGNPHKLDDQRENMLITIDRERLIRDVRWRDQIIEEERRALSGLDPLEIVYERDLLNPDRHQSTLDRILDYIGLERRPAKTHLRKINNRPLRDVIANYDDFAAWAKELGWTDADNPTARTEETQKAR